MIARRGYFKALCSGEHSEYYITFYSDRETEDKCETRELVESAVRDFIQSGGKIALLAPQEEPKYPITVGICKEGRVPPRFEFEPDGWDGYTIEVDD